MARLRRDNMVAKERFSMFKVEVYMDFDIRLVVGEVVVVIKTQPGLDDEPESVSGPAQVHG